jgi:hypothetical protein
MERVINAFETWCWTRMLEVKWTGRIMSDEVYQRVKEGRLLLKIEKNRRHPWIGHTVRHNEFVVNNLVGAISVKKRPWEDLDYNTWSKSPETQQLTVVQQWRERLATIPDGKLPAVQKIEG